jgi:hypothetical protein
MPMKKLSGVLAVCAALLGASTASADSLADLVPNLFGKGGILLAPPQTGFSHAPHFTASSEAQLTVINDSLRSQLSNIPLPSPASGFTFQFDPSLGAFTRSSDNFGPIYSQRADTTGKGKMTFGLTYSRFTFDKLDGINLSNGDLKVTFLHEPTGEEIGLPPFAFEKDTITAQIKASLTSDVFVRRVDRHPDHPQRDAAHRDRHDQSHRDDPAAADSPVLERQRHDDGALLRRVHGDRRHRAARQVQLLQVQPAAHGRRSRPPAAVGQRR